MDLQFGNYTLKSAERMLLGPNGPVELSARSFDILDALLAKPDEVVGKAHLFEAVWPGLAVEENTLQVHISALRKALPAGMIMTVHGRGYKYAGAMPFPATAEPQEKHRPSIAVLPFDNMSGDPEQDYFADGIAEDIIIALSRIRWLFVIARNSSFTYRTKSIDPRQIGRELGVRYLLYGSIRKAGQRVRISGQLVEAATGAHMWADRFDGDMSEIFELQDRVTSSVVIAVEPSVRLAEIERARRKPTENLDAYDLYLHALPAINVYTRAGFKEAEGLLRRAVALDPTYADALAALAECLVRMTVNGWAADKRASTAEACELTGQAISADPENASVLAVAAWAYSTLGVRFEQSLDLATRALVLHPNSVHMRSFCGWVFHYMGDSLRAIEQFEEA